MVQSVEALGDVALDEPGRARSTRGTSPAARCGSRGPGGSHGSGRRTAARSRLQDEPDHLLQQLVRPGGQPERRASRSASSGCTSAGPASIDTARSAAASMMASIFARDIPSTVSAVDARRHRPALRAILPYASRYRSAVEQQSIDALQRQSSPAAVADDPQDRLGVPHLAYLPPSWADRQITCLPSPCGRLSRAASATTTGAPSP